MYTAAGWFCINKYHHETNMGGNKWVKWEAACCHTQKLHLHAAERRKWILYSLFGGNERVLQHRYRLPSVQRWHLWHNFFRSGVTSPGSCGRDNSFSTVFTLCFLFVFFYLTPLFRVFLTHLNVIYDARGVSVKTIRTKDAFWWHPKVAWGHGSCCLHF